MLAVMSDFFDVHVHFYQAAHLRSAKMPAGYAPLPRYGPREHLEALARTGWATEKSEGDPANAPCQAPADGGGEDADDPPKGLVISVYMSVFDGPAHVLDSLERFDALRHASARWADTRMLGVVDADPAHADDGLLEDPRILGVRFTVPRLGLADFERGYQSHTPQWAPLFARLSQRGQHVLIYAKDPAVCEAMLRWVPAEISVGVDHFGLFDLGTDGSPAAGFEAMLASARQRGNVYFKGPGYRAAASPDLVAPHVRRVIEAVGADRVILCCTDAPNVGVQPGSGTPYRTLYPDVQSVSAYTHALAERVCGQPIAGVRVTPRQLLEDNARNLYLEG